MRYNIYSHVVSVPHHLGYPLGPSAKNSAIHVDVFHLGVYALGHQLTSGYDRRTALH